MDGHSPAPAGTLPVRQSRSELVRRVGSSPETEALNKRSPQRRPRFSPQPPRDAAQVGIHGATPLGRCSLTASRRPALSMGLSRYLSGGETFNLSDWKKHSMNELA